MFVEVTGYRGKTGRGGLFDPPPPFPNLNRVNGNFCAVKIVNKYT